MAQKPKNIDVEYAEFSDINQTEMPGAFLLTGKVRIVHDGITITCNKAYYFQEENYAKLFGNVQMVQGDTLYLNSQYAEYSGNEKKAYATGKPVLRSPDMTLSTDTINFDRNTQQAFYNSFGRIVNKENTLTSNAGRYYATEKKFQFLSTVTITNPKYVIKSNHVDYYNNSGHAYLFGPSTITSEKNFIYTEKGFYDSKKNVGHFLRKSYIRYEDRLIEGDSIFYDRAKEFASATRNVKVTDTVNKGIVKGHYGEVFKLKDSLMMTGRAVAINLVENDSVYIHGKKLMVTGKKGNQVIRAFNNARFFKSDLSGKCDSIHSSTKKALTQLIGRPVIWNGENQLTGDIIHLIGDNRTEKIDSLKVINNAFMISRDSLGTGYNQAKGLNMYGKFKDNKLDYIDLIKNTEAIYYVYDDATLTGIEKKISSSINITFDENKIDVMTSYKNVESQMYPEKDLPENARRLRGFIWRGDEIIRTKDDIFPPEEEEFDAKMQQESKIDAEKENKPMEIRKETLNYDKQKPVKK
ncbi:OstA-like protein [Flavobacterium tegetincola]|uniref:OstA-like protein n=1 Tax=Flavobacterium tegetincola TaxID=150172 RepID=UPI001FDF6BE9|nr:OstA-like protein [Flavobacterium tegetincola]